MNIHGFWNVLICVLNAVQTQREYNACSTRFSSTNTWAGFKLWRFTFPIIIKKRATIGLSAKRRSLCDWKCPVTVFWLGFSNGLVVQIREVGLNYRTSHSQWSYKADYYRPVSETPLEWRFTDGPTCGVSKLFSGWDVAPGTPGHPALRVAALFVSLAYFEITKI